MASSTMPALPEGSTHSQHHSHNRSHRKVPQRLPLEALNSNNNNNHNSFGGNGFSEHPTDENTSEQNGFVTPATSRFPSQDMAWMMGQNHYGTSHPVHTHSHSISSSHAHAHPAMYSHTPILAGQSVLETPYQNTKITSALVSLLIALPFVLSSLVQVSPFELAEPENEVDGGGIRLRARMQSRYLSFLGVCSLTAATLVTVGFIGELQSARRSKPSGKSLKSGREQLVSLASFKKVGERILSIGLPFYATSKLGGERVAVVTLIALAAELASKTTYVGHDPVAGAWSLAKARKWTFGALVLQCIADLINLTTPSLPMQTISGYLALSISVLILPWPFPAGGTTTSRGIADKGSRRNSNASSWETFGTSLPLSPLISSTRDTELTVTSGVLATIISFVVFVLSSQETQTLTLKLLFGGSIVSIASAVSLLFADSRAILPSNTSLSLMFALGASLFIQEIIDSHPLLPILFQSGIILTSWVCVCLDVKWLQPHVSGHEAPPSWFTKMILRGVEDKPLLLRIFSKKDSRRILYFMCMNFTFMFIQGVYGYLTGSLGLLSDTVHMFFDCAALGVGLVATILSEKSASLEYPHGFTKIDALAGFGNGVLLMAISVEIVYEAVERLASGSQVNRLGELLIVSTGGLLVNIFGLVAFGHHGHSHGHGHDHDHGHSHDYGHKKEHLHDHDHDHNHEHKHDEDCQIHQNQSENHHHSHSHIFDAPNANGGFSQSPTQPSPLPLSTFQPPAPSLQELATQVHGNHGHSHHHGHSHSHEGGSNMRGIYLHILADMMGSISVMVSTVLVHYTGWPGWDALASVAISYFIIVATIPLVKRTAKELVLDIPEDNEFDLREALSGVGQLRGVVNITAPRFWLEPNQTSGVMHVVGSKGADLDDVRERTTAYLRGRGMDVLVQVEREGEGRCWCGSTTAGMTRGTS